MRADGAEPKPSASPYCRTASGEKSGRGGQAPKSAATELLADIGLFGDGCKPQVFALHFPGDLPDICFPDVRRLVAIGRDRH